jgi:hypothetical protein
MPDAGYSLWATRAREAAARLPELPSFAGACSGERERLFRELGYTFWNRELVDGMAARCRKEGPLRWVELAAGTGRWTAEMARRGLSAGATDDYSQAPERVRSHQRAIRYGDWVGKLSARDAVAQLRPDGVFCAWPPLGSGLVPDLLAGDLSGSETLRLVVCIGEPGGATEAPTVAEELPEGWGLEAWPECEACLVGFNDPPPAPGWRSHSRLLVYRRVGFKR